MPDKPVVITESCGIGTFKCHGECTTNTSVFATGADEVGIVSFRKGSSFGAIQVNISAGFDAGTGVPGFTEYEYCYPDGSNGMTKYASYDCVTGHRIDQADPAVFITMTFVSCNKWTKNIRDLANQHVCHVECEK